MNRFRWFLGLGLFMFIGTWLFLYFRYGISIIPGSYKIIFIDLHTITDSVDSIRAGLNPYIDTSFDPLSRTYNYPEIWLNVFNFLGLNGAKTNVFGSILVLFFYLCNLVVLKPINGKETLFYLLLLLSPPVLLLIERCNSDMTIFMIIFLATQSLRIEWILKNYLFGFLILFASILKLYPVFLLPTVFLLKTSKRLKLGLSSVLLALFFAYFFFKIDNYLLVVSNTPLASTLSYGRNVFLQKLFTGATLQLVSLGLCLMVVLLALLPALFSWKKANSGLNEIFGDAGFSDRLFWHSGSLIYLGTFYLGNSWDYRLVFLLFTLPILQQHYRHLFSRAYLFSLVCVFFLDFVANFKISQELGLYFVFHLIHQISSWVIFYLLALVFFDEVKRVWKESLNTPALSFEDEV